MKHVRKCLALPHENTRAQLFDCGWPSVIRIQRSMQTRSNVASEHPAYAPVGLAGAAAGRAGGDATGDSCRLDAAALSCVRGGTGGAVRVLLPGLLGVCTSVACVDECALAGELGPVHGRGRGDSE